VVAQESVSSAAQPTEHHGLGARQVVGTVITMAVLAIVFVGILPQFGDYGEAWTAIQDLSWGWLGALAAATLISILVYVWPFQAALPGLTYRHGFIVRQTSFTISNAVPAGGAIGLGVQYDMLSRYGYGTGAPPAAIGITSVWNLIVTLALPVFAVVGLIVDGRATSSYLIAAGLGVLAVGVSTALLALTLRSERAARRLGAAANRLVKRVMGAVHRPADPHVDETLVSFRNATVEVIRARWPPLTATNVLQQLAQFAVLWVAYRGIETSTTATLTLFGAFAAFAFARLASFIPITPGGLCTVDAGLAGLLTAAGASRTDALAAILVWRAASYFPQVAIGIVTFLHWRREQARQVRTAV
jgi:uncharacterized protein (TIRG00374 family)